MTSEVFDTGKMTQVSDDAMIALRPISLFRQLHYCDRASIVFEFHVESEFGVTMKGIRK